MASRPSKYAHVTGALTKLDTVAPERKAIVDAVKSEILAPLAADEQEDYNRDAQVRSQLDQIDGRVQQVLTLAKRLTAGRTSAAALARGYATARGVMDAVDSWKSSTQVLLDAYEALMLAALEAEGVASLRLDSGASVSTSVEPYGQVKDKEAFRLWCVANGYEGQLQLWPSTMNAITKERTLAGEPPPDGVEVFAKTVVRLNKA